MNNNIEQDVVTLIVQLFGRFSLSDNSGVDRTPTGQKSKGVLALLATSPKNERGRLWLQDKLWSDRAPPQASASLRQALVDIRRSLGPYSDLLKSNRTEVWFEPGMLETLPQEHAQEEFLEGIDIRDQEFEAWLSVQRSASSNPEGLTAPPVQSTSEKNLSAVFIVCESATGQTNHQMEQLVGDAIARAMTETLAVDIFRELPASVPSRSLLISASLLGDDNDKKVLRLEIQDVSTLRSIWSEARPVETRAVIAGEDLGVFSLVNTLMDEILSFISHKSLPQTYDTDAGLLCALAIADIFSMRSQRLETAEQRLRLAFEIEPRGEYQGWLAQLFAIQYVERFASLNELSDKAAEACAKGIALQPRNSHVLAAVANARLVLEKQIVTCGELARMSVKINPGNPLAWWSLSAAKIYYGSHDDAYRSAARASALAAGTRFQFWTDFQKSISALMVGRLGESLRLSEASSAMAPYFRPPLRYATAAYASLGAAKAASRKASDLTKIEPDFDLTRLAKDHDYPASLLHQSDVIEVNKLLNLDALL